MLVGRDGHNEPVPLLLKLWPLLAHHLGQQLVLQALSGRTVVGCMCVCGRVPQSEPVRRVQGGSCNTTHLRRDREVDERHADARLWS